MKNKGKKIRGGTKHSHGGANQERPDSSGLSGGHMGAGRSGKEDMGSEKPQDGLGSNKPGQGAGGENAVDDNTER